MEAGAEDILDSRGPEVAGADDELKIRKEEDGSS